MSKLFLVNIDMSGNEIQNAVIQPLAAAPQSATVGRIYYDTTDHALKVYDGTNWNIVGNVLSVNSKTGAVTITKSDLGLGNVDNTSDATKKSNFTGSIADNNTGFVTGDMVYDALAGKYEKPSAGIPLSDLVSEVQTLINGALQTTGGTMSGNIKMGGYKVTGLAQGSAIGEAVTYQQLPKEYTGTPTMNGTGSSGTSAFYSRGNHVHPTDTSRMAANLKGAANGVAELDSNGKVPSSQLPSFVDDVIEGYYISSKSKFFEDSAGTIEITGESAKIYVDLNDNKTYRWSGTTYAEISSSLTLGTTVSTAYRGDRGKIAYDHSQLTSGNPHHVSKSDVGLGNVDNTSDATKKTNFTGSIASGNTGFVTGGDVYTAINNASSGVIKTTTATIGTNATSVVKSLGAGSTFINAYATMAGEVVMVDLSIAQVAVGDSVNPTLTFSVAAKPSSAITITIIYV